MTDYNTMSLDDLYSWSDNYRALGHIEQANEIEREADKRSAVATALCHLAADLDAEGLVVVPREPTLAMQIAAQQTYAWYHRMTEGKDGGRASDTVDGFMWEAMIAAAPILPSANTPDDYYTHRGGYVGKAMDEYRAAAPLAPEVG